MNKKIATIALALAVAVPGIAAAQDQGIGGVDASGSPSERVTTDMTNAPRIDRFETRSITTSGYGTTGLDGAYANPVDAQAARDAQLRASNK